MSATTAAPKPVRPVNGRPARSRTAPKKVAGTSAPPANPCPPPQLLVTRYDGHDCRNEYTTVSYPPGTPGWLPAITTEAHREVICHAMLIAGTRFNSQRGDTLNFAILIPTNETAIGWTWQSHPCGREVFATDEFDALFLLARNKEKVKPRAE